MKTRRPWTWPRAECGEHPRPCGVITCRHNLAGELAARLSRRLGIRSSNADFEVVADRVVAWLASSAASCALDVVAANPDGLAADQVAELLDVDPAEVSRIVRGYQVAAAFEVLRDRGASIRASSCTDERTPLDRFRQQLTAKTLMPLEGRCSRRSSETMYVPSFKVPLAFVHVDVDGTFAPRSPSPTSAPLLASAADPIVAATDPTRPPPIKPGDFDKHLARMCRLARISAEDLKKHAPTQMLVVPELAKIAEDTAKRGA